VTEGSVDMQFGQDWTYPRSAAFENGKIFFLRSGAPILGYSALAYPLDDSSFCDQAALQKNFIGKKYLGAGENESIGHI
jgi:hypothetical protein